MIFSIKKKSLILGAACGVLVAVLVAVIAITNVSSVFFGTAPKRKLPVYSVDRGTEKVVAISFDAAWGADKTRGIMDILQRHEVTATFFLVGFWIDKFPEEVKLIADNGYEIGNHSRNHLKMSTLTRESISQEISYVNNKVRELTGKQCKVFRCPFGDYSDKVIEGIKESGLLPVQWDVDSLDWKGLNSAEISKCVCPKVKPGSIVLFHNNSEHILEALPLVLLNLKNEGYRFVTMSELLYSDNYTVDNNGVQHPSRETEKNKL